MKINLTTDFREPTNRFGQSVLPKLALIAILTLLLLIPSNWIQDLIRERQERQSEVIKEISEKWAGKQLLEGPILVLPYKTTVAYKDTAVKVGYKSILTNIYILPETLNMVSYVDTEVLHRGIFDAVVYNTKIKVRGKFSPLELKKPGLDPKLIQWDKAKVDIGLSDLKGLKNTPNIKLADTNYTVEPDFTGLQLFSNNLIISPDLSAKKNTSLEFSFDLDLRGSSELNFLPLGKTTTVTVKGPWKNPSFTGRYLPEERNISPSGFTATWKMPYFNRPYPQQWLAEASVLNNTPTNTASFGVKFILPVDQYQKTMRSAKYAILVIVLTFVSLFFTELIRKRKVHLLQYVLIGAAMSIYYTLLLSLSEQVGFNSAYLIASIATVALIGSFIAALMKNKGAAVVFSGILIVFYSFIYVIIQLQDLALLFGSVGLFLTIAALMYVSARIEWSRTETV